MNTHQPDESALATILANNVLGRQDPDDDMALLARQFLRAQCRWRCFFCDEVFIDREKALDHFGSDEGCYSEGAACKLTEQEGGILRFYREALNEIKRLQSDDGPSHRTFYALGAEHTTALLREEEKGFARGLDACRPILDAARELLANRHLNVDLSGKVDALAEAVGAYDGKPVE